MKCLRTTLLILILSFLLAACTASPTPLVNTSPTPGLNFDVTSTPPPSTETATPETGRIVLVSNQSPFEPEIISLMEPLGVDSGLKLDILPALSAADLTPITRVVILMEPDEGTLSLAQGAPAIQFVAITSQDLPVAANISAIRLHPVDEIFIAGYLTSIIAPDWRSGGLLPSDTPMHETIQDAFVNGGRYFCGRCAPAYAPVVLFPQAALLPSTSNPPEWEAAVNGLEVNRLETLYIHPAAASPDLLALLPSQGTILVGGQTPPAEFQQQWAATVRTDPASILKILFPDLLAGIGGQDLTAPIILTDVNPQYLSPGRQQRVEEVIQMLADGEIQPLSVPLN